MLQMYWETPALWAAIDRQLQPSALHLVPRLPELLKAVRTETTRGCCTLLRAAQVPELVSHGPSRSPLGRAQPCSAEPEAAADSPSRDPPGPLCSGAPARSGRGGQRGRSGAARSPRAPLGHGGPGLREPGAGMPLPAPGPRRPQPRRAEGRARPPRAAAAQACRGYSPPGTTGAESLKADVKQIKEPVQSKRHTVSSTIPVARNQGVETPGTSFVARSEKARENKQSHTPFTYCWIKKGVAETTMEAVSASSPVRIGRVVRMRKEMRSKSTKNHWLWKTRIYLGETEGTSELKQIKHPQHKRGRGSQAPTFEVNSLSPIETDLKKSAR